MYVRTPPVAGQAAKANTFWLGDIGYSEGKVAKTGTRRGKSFGENQLASVNENVVCRNFY